MSLFNRNSNVQSNQSVGSHYREKTSMGVVYKIILDVDDDILSDLEIVDELKSKYIGAIQFRQSGTSSKRDEALSLALPKDKTNISIPTVNETVIIINSPGGGYVYERIIGSPIPNLNTSTDEITSTQKKEKAANTNTASQYSKVQSTGITRSESSLDDTDTSKLGSYFEPQLNIHKLKLYEGDYLIESRFGQSIRFSGYNNSENSFSPTITIRNGESGESLDQNIGLSTEEDVNNDGNIIFLGSGQRLLNYTLPVDNSYESFFNYPSELTGNQILLNSDRIILSAKNAEMIGVAKKDIGFITDGQFSIDASRGINITTDDNIFVDTKDRDFNIDIGSGTIALGTDGDLEAAPKGETLVSLLSEMLDLISQQIYVTPAGPTSPGPTNVAQFAALKTKLNSMLSNNVQLK
jgi:hypothetical protein